MSGFVLSVPKKRVSAWTAETDPKYARAWLASLPMANSAESAREIYQSLYALNRQNLSALQRFELTQLYCAPVANVTSSLETYYIRAPLPLSPKRRQLAEFILQLHMEMAYSYKCCLQDLLKLRMLWRKKQLLVQAVDSAMYYLGEVLLRSYQVYMPYPMGVWKDIHELYHYAEVRGIHLDKVEAGRASIRSRATTIAHEYIQILLLSLSNPYQLPQNECRHVQDFLRRMAGKAVLQTDKKIIETGTNFLVNLLVDSPPVPLTQEISALVKRHARILNTGELVRTTRGLIVRMQRGNSVRALDVGVDCLDSVFLDLLHRLSRAWGPVVRRKYSRLKRRSHVFVCSGINALYFFGNAQKAFTVPTEVEESGGDRPVLPEAISVLSDEDYISLDQPVTVDAASPKRNPENVNTANEFYLLDRWQVRDSGPKGLFLARFSGSGTPIRIGDIVGVRHANDYGSWSAAVVRWMKSPEANSLEMGVEMLAAGVVPAMVRIKPENTSGQRARYIPALLLPAIDVLQRPATLLIARGVCVRGRSVVVMSENAAVRTVRLLQVLEQSNSFEQFVYADVLAD